MSRIFIYDDNADTIKTLRHALETSGAGHEVLANIVWSNQDKQAKLVTSAVDVIGLLIQTRPFPDVVIAEAERIDGNWLCGLIYDMELGKNCSVILVGHKKTKKIEHLLKLYGAHFFPKPFNVLHFVEYIETFLAVSC
ncbi:hypothetical protein KKH39_03520 [Patescibacteria group bacterium]|nr:hypothetical protein [Patescibacteria group bacterium]